MLTEASQSDVALSNSSSVVTKTPILNEGTVEFKREEILEYFHRTFSLYESIFDCLVDDDAYYARANMLRHPLIFYYGHTSVFYTAATAKPENSGGL